LLRGFSTKDSVIELKGEDIEAAAFEFFSKIGFRRKKIRGEWTWYGLIVVV